MNMNLHIDAIFLDGIDLAASDRRQLKHAVASELTSLLTRQDSGPRFQGLSDRPRVLGSALRYGPSADAVSLGPQLAGAICSGLSPSHAIYGGQR